MLALGRELQNRGWEIVFLTSEPYRELADNAGFHCEVIVDQAGFDDWINKPDFWHPFRGIRTVLSGTAEKLIQPCFEAIEKHHQPGSSILVSHMLDFGARIFRDKHPETPQVSVVLAPMAIRTPNEPPRLTHWWYEARWPPALIRAQFYLADQLFVRRWLGKPVNQFRQEVGLKPVHRPLKTWNLSPDCILGLFPSWFAPSKKHLPEQMVCTGFPLEDAAHEFKSRGATDCYFSDGVQPVIFAPGTANTHASKFFQAALDACQSLKLNGLFLTEHTKQLPSSLPPNIQHHRYLPFREALPSVQAIVHHGGVGTTSQAMAAATPQLIVPMAFDQFDNAERMERVGCGRKLFKSRLSAKRMTTLLNEVISDPQIRENCKKTSERLMGTRSVELAVDKVEAVFTNRNS